MVRYNIYLVDGRVKQSEEYSNRRETWSSLTCTLLEVVHEYMPEKMISDEGK
jgi:hypothetical protein